MGCGCKTNKDGTPNLDENNEGTLNIFLILWGYLLKLIVFGFFILLLPILNMYLFYIIFKSIMLNKDFNSQELIGSLIKLAIKFKPNNQDFDEYEDSEEYYELTEDDVTMLDVEDITNK